MMTPEDFLERLMIAIVVGAAIVGTLLYYADPAEGRTPTCDSGYTYVKEVDICAANDYYKVDGIRMPLGMQSVGDYLAIEHARLPTREEVDAIWRAADVKLSPYPLMRYDIMTTMGEFIRHDTIINEQLAALGVGPDEQDVLIAGHKKDIIQPQRAGRVTIYGWHRLNGHPIQPVSSVHGYTYRDYSHGLRLVKDPS